MTDEERNHYSLAHRALIKRRKTLEEIMPLWYDGDKKDAPVEIRALIEDTTKAIEFFHKKASEK